VPGEPSEGHPSSYRVGHAGHGPAGHRSSRRARSGPRLPRGPGAGQKTFGRSGLTYRTGLRPRAGQRQRAPLVRRTVIDPDGGASRRRPPVCGDAPAGRADVADASLEGGRCPRLASRRRGTGFRHASAARTPCRAQVSGASVPTPERAGMPRIPPRASSPGMPAPQFVLAQRTTSERHGCFSMA